MADSNDVLVDQTMLQTSTEAPVEAEAPKIETPAEPAPAEDKFAAKFAALSRKEKALRDEMRAFQAQKAEWDTKLKEHEETGKKYSSFSERLKSEPLKVLEENGLSYDQLTKSILENDGKPTSDMQLELLKEQTTKSIEEIRKENAALREELAAKDKKAQEEYYDTVVEDFKEDIRDLVTENPEDYAVINASENGIDLVYDVIENHYQQTKEESLEDPPVGLILDKKEAADMVEKHLLEEARKFAKVNKIKELLAAENKQTAKEPRNVQSSPTLTNTQTSQVSTNKGRMLSDEESLAEAAKLIRWDAE